MENLLKLFVSARILKPLMSLCVGTWLTIVFLVNVRGVLIGLCFMLGNVRTAIALAKVRLFVRCRAQGCYIASVPLKRLVELSGYDKTRWSFKDGWLILEAF